MLSSIKTSFLQSDLVLGLMDWKECLRMRAKDWMGKDFRVFVENVAYNSSHVSFYLFVLSPAFLFLFFIFFGARAASGLGIWFLCHTFGMISGR